MTLSAHFFLNSVLFFFFFMMAMERLLALFVPFVHTVWTSSSSRRLIGLVLYVSYCFISLLILCGNSTVNVPVSQAYRKSENVDARNSQMFWGLFFFVILGGFADGSWVRRQLILFCCSWNYFSSEDLFTKNCAKIFELAHYFNYPFYRNARNNHF